MQEDKEPLFDAVETACACLEVLSGTIRTLRVNRQAMAAAAADPMLLATDLAEHLVEARVPFREAHEVVGRIVAHALDAGTPLSALSRDTLTAFHPALDIDPATFFSAERSLEARSLIGGPARKAVDAALREAQRLIETTREELGATGDPA
jgi:argininosuccinate lyase